MRVEQWMKFKGRIECLTVNESWRMKESCAVKKVMKIIEWLKVWHSMKVAG